AWNEYDACAPSGCLRVRGILPARSPHILRLQTVFRILTSAHSCRIRVESAAGPCSNRATPPPPAPGDSAAPSVLASSLQVLTVARGPVRYARASEVAARCTFPKARH